jgi:hypothetical protein
MGDMENKGVSTTISLPSLVRHIQLPNPLMLWTRTEGLYHYSHHNTMTQILSIKKTNEYYLISENDLMKQSHLTVKLMLIRHSNSRRRQHNKIWAKPELLGIWVVPILLLEVSVD